MASMEENKVNTPIEYMLELEWELDDLEHAINYMKDWDTRGVEFYRNYSKMNKNFDISEREHYRNCINFWKERLNYENKST